MFVYYFQVETRLSSNKSSNNRGMFILTAFTIRSNPHFETKTLFIRITCRFETFVQTEARPNQSLCEF